MPILYCGTADFSGTALNLIQSSAMDTPTDEPCTSTEQSSINTDNLVKQIEEFTADITARVKENTSVAQGMQTFLRGYESMTENGQFNNARLSSGLHCFGWVFDGSIKIHKVDTSVEEEFLSMLYQQEDTNSLPKEKQNSQLDN